MRKLKALMMIGTAACVLATPAVVLADWDVGDGAKMHAPQLPDPNGWDVSWYFDVGEPIELADDWQCPADALVTKLGDSA
jgi:hypothetical protein